MKKGIEILDCTLRDGGYYTNWDFDKSIVDTYINAFNHLPVDYLELGYRSTKIDGYYGEYFYCPVKTIKRIKEQSNKKLVVLLDEKDVSVKDAQALLNPITDLVTIVRLAVNPANFKRALDLGKEVKKLGFELSFNVMYMSTWTEQKVFLELVPEVEGLVDYFYMVDSFGGVYPADVKETIALIRSKTKAKLGFHGHNNLEMALANTLTAIEEGIDIVDATITGMGRGAGNLKTELLLTALNAKHGLHLPFNELSKVVGAFTALQEKYRWGTNLPYMVSGANSLPQKQVMSWVTKRYYSFNSIIRALTNQSEGKKDNLELPKMDFAGEKSYKNALIVGGGPSVVQHAEGIVQFLIHNPDTVVIHASSRNAMCFAEAPNDQFFCLVGNEGHRLEDVFGDASAVKGKCILPPYPRKMGTYIPEKLIGRAYELKNVAFTEVLQNTHTALAIETARELGLKNIYVVGYDSYSGTGLGEKELDFITENEFLFQRAKECDMELVSLTSSNYKNLVQKSLFSFIA